MTWRATMLFFAAALLANAAEIMPPSPIEQFRSWLDLPEEQRATVLASRSSRSRELLEAKLREYSQLPAAERDRRLKVMDIHWHLKPVLEAPATNRVVALAKVPAKMKSVIEDRLQRWEKLPPHVKDDVLTNETAMSFFIAPPVPPVEPPMPSIDFNRAEMERTLENYANLSLHQRQQCIDSFAALARMTAADRNQFLRNAERWQEMSEEERDTWRQIVNIRPPSPPGLEAPMPTAAR